MGFAGDVAAMQRCCCNCRSSRQSAAYARQHAHPDQLIALSGARRGQRQVDLTDCAPAKCITLVGYCLRLCRNDSKLILQLKNSERKDIKILLDFGALTETVCTPNSEPEVHNLVVPLCNPLYHTTHTTTLAVVSFWRTKRVADIEDVAFLGGTRPGSR